MSAVGIEAIGAYGGAAFVDVAELAEHRGLDQTRFANLLMREKAIAMPYEDPVSFAVNAAAPLVRSLSEDDRASIELLVTCTESGIDFGKSLSTYLHDLLGLSRTCRLFEVKAACYSGTAGLQTAVSFVLSNVSPGARALVIATDIARFTSDSPGEARVADWSFAEPSVGAGAVAMLISDRPEVLVLDVGASGYHGYEIMDTCRPRPDSESGDADASLMSYLDCCAATFAEYQRRVADADYLTTFDRLCFHTPFGGMVKGAHRTMLRRLHRLTPDEIEDDFHRRVEPGLSLCQRVGNIMGGTLYLNMLGAISDASTTGALRLGLFAYGSGCCSEFFSGVVPPGGVDKVRSLELESALDDRYRLGVDEYDALRAFAKKKVVGGDVLFLPALSFLYLLGLIEYRPKIDAVEYVGPNETIQAL